MFLGSYFGFRREAPGFAPKSVLDLQALRCDAEIDGFPKTPEMKDAVQKIVLNIMDFSRFCHQKIQGSSGSPLAALSLICSSKCVFPPQA